MRNIWLEMLRRHPSGDVVVTDARTLSRNDLVEEMTLWDRVLTANKVRAGDVVAIVGDFFPATISLLFALLERGCIVLPQIKRGAVTNTNFQAHQRRSVAIAQATTVVEFASDTNWVINRTGYETNHAFFDELRRRGHAGVVLFSSGSTGESKGVVLDAEFLVEKFETSRAAAARTLTFLLFDHIGGLNTLLATVLTGGTVIVPPARDVETVCRTIEQQRVEVLPTAPTFLRVLLMADAAERYDLSSLRLITYGAEPMYDVTLRALNKRFPNIRLKQTYGLTELGIFSTSSRSNDSLWVKVGGTGVETKVVDNLLYVRSSSAMLGYLNAAQPFDADGWYCTGDLVEVDGPYLRILGRQNEIINVGGEKLFPVEVENTIMELENVSDVTVSGKRNAVMGEVVIASVVLTDETEDPAHFSSRARAFCLSRLPEYKVPMLFQIVDVLARSQRFKKVRRRASDVPPKAST